MKILEILQGNSRVDVQELSILFAVSVSTIRRDLKELEGSNLLKRTHGGAVVFHNVNFEPTYLQKEDIFGLEKMAIAKKAVEFISNGDSVLLDSGTTTYYLAKQLKAFKKLTVVTNSLAVANELRHAYGIELLIIGGFLRTNTQAIVGAFAENNFNMINVDKSFVSTNGFDLKQGVTTPNLTEANTKRRMIECAKEVYLIADSSKAGVVTFSKFAELKDFHHCIVDSGIPDFMVHRMKDDGVQVHIVEA